MEGLKVENLSVQREGKQVLTDICFQIEPSELLVLEGANGAGKSTLALTLLGHPSCAVTGGTMTLCGQDLTPLQSHERARLGLFLAHQEPAKIPGVTIAETLRTSCEALQGKDFTIPKFYEQLRAGLRRLGLPEEFSQRTHNEQLSGGEKKRGELLALLLVRPVIAILDELDSGLDVETRILAKEVIEELRMQRTGFLVISHNQQFVEGLRPTQRLRFTATNC